MSEFGQLFIVRLLRGTPVGGYIDSGARFHFLRLISRGSSYFCRSECVRRSPYRPTAPFRIPCSKEGWARFRAQFRVACCWQTHTHTHTEREFAFEIFARSVTITIGKRRGVKHDLNCILSSLYYRRRILGFATTVEVGTFRGLRRCSGRPAVRPSLGDDRRGSITRLWRNDDCRAGRI